MSEVNGLIFVFALIPIIGIVGGLALIGLGNLVNKWGL